MKKTILAALLIALTMGASSSAFARPGRYSPFIYELLAAMKGEHMEPYMFRARDPINPANRRGPRFFHSVVSTESEIAQLSVHELDRSFRVELSASSYLPSKAEKIFRGVMARAERRIGRPIKVSDAVVPPGKRARFSITAEIPANAITAEELATVMKKILENLE